MFSEFMNKKEYLIIALFRLFATFSISLDSRVKRCPIELVMIDCFNQYPKRTFSDQKPFHSITKLRNKYELFITSSVLITVSKVLDLNSSNLRKN